MVKKEAIKPIGSLYRFVPREEERKVEAALLKRMVFEIHVIREFESKLLFLKDQGLIHGPVHSSIGQEGAAVGAITALKKTDVIGSTHRGHHHFLAKAFTAHLPSYDPSAGLPEGIGPLVKKTMAEIMGLKQGYCRGRGGSMHLGDKSAGCLGTNAIVAGGVPILTGAAWSQRIDSNGGVSVSFLGDGAMNQGAVHEVMNMAVLWKLPVVYFLENNLYAVATHVKESSSLEHLGQRGLGYGMDCMIVDGMDPVAVYLAMKKARETALGGLPVLIEAKTYRFKHQAQSLPGSAFGYRTKEEEAEWLRLDPDKRLPDEMIAAGVISKKEDDDYRKAAAALVEEAASSLVKIENRKMYIPPDLFPGKEEFKTGVKSDGGEFAGCRYSEPEDFPVKKRKAYLDVVPEVMLRRMDEDRAAIVIGEEVGHMKGGAYLATKGLFLKYRDRVIDTPISENGFIGMSLGLALFGKRPIVEIMFPDFGLVAADQLFNQIGKCRYMYGNQFDVPLVMRTRVAVGTGYGAQHCMEPASLFGLFVGWRIVAPSTPFDYIGLFNTAYRSLDPVLVIEHQALYPIEGEVPEDRDFLIPFGKARITRRGNDVTLVSYSRMASRSLEAAEKLAGEGLDVEVIDLRTIDYENIDYKTIGESLRRTGRLLIVEEGHHLGGIGAQVADEVQRRFFDYLDAEIERIAGVNVPMPVSKPLEDAAVPSVEEIANKIKTMLH